MTEAIHISEFHKMSEVVMCANFAVREHDMRACVIGDLVDWTERQGGMGFTRPQAIANRKGSVRPDREDTKILRIWRLTGQKKREVCGVVDTHSHSGDSGTLRAARVDNDVMGRSRTEVSKKEEMVPPCGLFARAL